MKFKILDCTLRDGGYYTNWDFDQLTVDSYLEAMNNLPIDYIEIGYRSIKLDGYLGEYYYLPIETIKKTLIRVIATLYETFFLIV